MGGNKKDQARRKQKKAERQRKKRQQPARAPVSMRGAVETASRWPVIEAFVVSGWREQGSSGVVLVRGTDDGRYAVASFYVDLWCMGVKVADVKTELDQSDVEHMLARLGGGDRLEPCRPELVAAIVEVGAAYGTELGFRQDPDLPLARLMLHGLDPSAAGEVVEAGKDGKPLYIAGPSDDARSVIAHLHRKLGPDGFHYIAPIHPDQ